MKFGVAGFRFRVLGLKVQGFARTLSFEVPHGHFQQVQAPFWKSFWKGYSILGCRRETLIFSNSDMFYPDLLQDPRNSTSLSSFLV